MSPVSEALFVPSSLEVEPLASVALFVPSVLEVEPLASVALFVPPLSVALAVELEPSSVDPVDAPGSDVPVEPGSVADPESDPVPTVPPAVPLPAVPLPGSVVVPEFEPLGSVLPVPSPVPMPVLVFPPAALVSLPLPLPAPASAPDPVPWPASDPDPASTVPAPPSTTITPPPTRIGRGTPWSTGGRIGRQSGSGLAGPPHPAAAIKRPAIAPRRIRRITLMPSPRARGDPAPGPPQTRTS
jgi:hypothetical protein